MIHMKKNTELMATPEDLFIDLTLHQVPASLLTEFAKKVVRPYYGGNLNSAIKDLISKTLSEQEFVHSHITPFKTA